MRLSQGSSSDTVPPAANRRHLLATGPILASGLAWQAYRRQGPGLAAATVSPAGIAHEVPLETATVVALPGGPAVLDPYASAAALTWFRGQLHAHSARSFDGDPRVPPDRRAALYAAAGYDFSVFTDHDRVTALAPAGDGQAPVTFAGVESSDPSAHLGVWLIPGSPAAGTLPLPHPREVERARDPASRIEAWAAAGALVCCNHPSHASAPLAPAQVADWAGAGVPFRFLEVFNTRANRQPSDLAHNLETWRAAITAAGPERPVWGVAADDAHGAGDCGGAWISVASESLAPAALRDALLAGRLYASSGLAFTTVGVDQELGAIAATAPGADTIRFVAADGTVRRQVAAESASYVPRTADRWVRVEATGAGNRAAWSQPFWVLG